MDTIDLSEKIKTPGGYSIDVKRNYITYRYRNSNNSKIKCIRISPGLFMVLEDAKLTNSINKDIFNSLDDTEKSLALVTIKQLGIDIDNSDLYSGGDLKKVLEDNFDVLKGEYNSGNKTKYIKEAMINTIKMMYISNYIKKKEYLDYIDKINKIHIS